MSFIISIPKFSFVKKRLLTMAIAFAIFAVASMPSHAQENPQLVEGMQALKTATAGLGEPSLNGENLLFGVSQVNGDYSVVDAVTEKVGGTATLFAKKDSNYVRVSTNVIKDGKRAVGTILDPAGPAYAAIQQGEAFYGIVDILGTFYDTGYEPIKNAAGDTIGIYYVGYSAE